MPAGLQARILSRLDAAEDTAERPSRIAALRQRSWSMQALAAAAVFGAVISSSVMMTLDSFRSTPGSCEPGRRRTYPRSDGAPSRSMWLRPIAIRSSRGSPRGCRNRRRCRTSRRKASRCWVAASMSSATRRWPPSSTSMPPTPSALTTLRAGQSVSDQAVAGYNVRSWSDPGFHLCPRFRISPAADLATFERVFSGRFAPHPKSNRRRPAGRSARTSAGLTPEFHSDPLRNPPICGGFWRLFSLTEITAVIDPAELCAVPEFVLTAFKKL